MSDEKPLTEEELNLLAEIESGDAQEWAEIKERAAKEIRSLREKLSASETRNKELIDRVSSLEEALTLAKKWVAGNPAITHRGYQQYKKDMLIVEAALSVSTGHGGGGQTPKWGDGMLCVSCYHSRDVHNQDALPGEPPGKTVRCSLEDCSCGGYTYQRQPANPAAQEKCPRCGGRKYESGTALDTEGRERLVYCRACGGTGRA